MNEARKLTEEMEREEARLLNECPRPKNATGACGLPSCLLCWPALALRKGRAALEAALAREATLREGIENMRSRSASANLITADWLNGRIDSLLAALPVETQEAGEPDDYTRPGWRMFPVL